IGVHFGISHWPFKWGNDTSKDNELLSEQYKMSLRAADQQIQSFYHFLKTEKLLNHAILILVSDHGIGLGLPGDRIIHENHYVGNSRDVSLFQKLPYNHVAIANSAQQVHYGIDTSYGYSTDILSPNQYRILLAFLAHGVNIGEPQK